MMMDMEPLLGSTRHISFRSICIGLFLSVWIVATATAEDEKEILESFFIASEGEQWIVKTNWATEEPICSWFGVTCGFNLSNASGVIALELPGNNVAREVSELVYQMPFLETIDLRHNPIVNPGFTGMGRAAQNGLLSPFKSINFGYCLLTKVDGIQDAPETLVDLELTKNQITAGFPSEILSLTNLQKLYLNFNDMEGSLPREIGNLKLLKELYLFSNKMTGTLPSEIGFLDKMEFFTLGDNEFHGSIPQEVNNMLNLQIFSLHASEEGGGKLTGKLPSFANAGYLEKIYLSNNALTGEIPDDFLVHNSNTGEIVSINLKNNKISGTIPDSFGRFDNLDLDLVGNEIEGPLPESFCNMGRWMSGLVEQYGCNAILCPAGFYNDHGLQVEDQHPCTECKAFPSPYFGATRCGSPELKIPPELKILADLYLTLQGSQWEQNDGWNQFDTLIQNSHIDSADLSELVPCSFYGIICSNAGQVEILTLGNNGLKGKIPASVFRLPGLVELDMSYNYVDVDDDSGGFATLKDATKLARLKLSHTNIASLEGIGQAVTLEELHLDGSDFESSLPSELFDLTNLRVLHLDASFLTGPLPSDIKRLSGLTRYVKHRNLQQTLTLIFVRLLTPRLFYRLVLFQPPA
jgi:Leucine-rich repeat (LRR) protein